MQRRLLHLLTRKWDRQTNGTCGFVETLDVFFEFEDAAIVNADTLKDTVALGQDVLESGDLRVLDAVDWGGDVNLHLGGVGD